MALRCRTPGRRPRRLRGRHRPRSPCAPFQHDEIELVTERCQGAVAQRRTRRPRTASKAIRDSYRPRQPAQTRRGRHAWVRRAARRARRCSSTSTASRPTTRCSAMAPAMPFDGRVKLSETIVTGRGRPARRTVARCSASTRGTSRRLTANRRRAQRERRWVAMNRVLRAQVVPDQADRPSITPSSSRTKRMHAHKARPVLRRLRPGPRRAHAHHARQQLSLHHHSSDVAEPQLRTARRFPMTAEGSTKVARAAELHDVGKVGVLDAHLEQKPGPLEPHAMGVHAPATRSRRAHPQRRRRAAAGCTAVAQAISAGTARTSPTASAARRSARLTHRRCWDA